jgi:hypothetical protein
VDIPAGQWRDRRARGRLRVPGRPAPRPDPDRGDGVGPVVPRVRHRGRRAHVREHRVLRVDAATLGRLDSRLRSEARGAAREEAGRYAPGQERAPADKPTRTQQRRRPPTDLGANPRLATGSAGGRRSQGQTPHLTSGMWTMAGRAPIRGRSTLVAIGATNSGRRVSQIW